MMAYYNCHIAGGPIRTKKPLLQSRVELYLQFEGCIRHTTLWELMVSKKIQMPTPEPAETPDYKAPQLQDVISFMVSRTEGSNDLIGRKLQLCLDVLSDDPEAVARVCHEFSEDVLRKLHGSIKKLPWDGLELKIQYISYLFKFFFLEFPS